MNDTIRGFIQPRRRLTRQRSGFNVGGMKTGSEARIHKSSRFKVLNGQFSLNKHLSEVIFTKLFSEDIGIFGSGGYFRVQEKLSIDLTIKLSKNNNLVVQASSSFTIQPNIWSRVASDIQLDKISDKEKFSADVHIAITSDIKEYLVEFFWLQADVVKYYAEKENYKQFYYQNTDIYKPEIYYLTIDNFDFDEDGVQKLEDGFIIGKSCNRCARFLPIDIENENNALGFSNHCKKRAPCTHNAFSRFYIENLENISTLPDNFKNLYVKEENGKYFINSNLGFQLECRSCKKFEVNAPLNPLRNKAQHHEDGARRRALERLIIELTGEDYVKNFRLRHKIEFQDYIWENFNKKCFSCDKQLTSINDMHIDHTLPLAYLWPLDISATALCSTCNSLKHDLFPCEFPLYDKNKIRELSIKTKIPLELLESKEKLVNKNVSQILVQKVVWFFDEFLNRDDYQKIKKGKKVADLIYKAVNKVLSLENINLLQEYYRIKKEFPKSISIN